MGFTNYYQRFLRGYAQIAHSLNKLTSGKYSTKKKHPIDWDNACEESFLKLKELCTSTLVLAYADYSRPFKLHTDASSLGLGAVLYQTHEDGKDRVIAYASRVLSHTEAKYPAHKWAVTDRFHEYLYGGIFEVYADNNPLTYILTTAKLDAIGQCWVASLANCDFKLFYKSGQTNMEADDLSRIPWNTELDRDSIKTIILAKSSQWSPLYETW